MSLFRVGVIPLACLFALSITAAQAQQPAPAEKGAPAPAAAPAVPPSLTVIVVDVQKLLQESKAAKMVREQIEGKRAEYAKEISKQEQTLQQERDALQRQQSSLSQEQLNAKGRAFQEKVNDLDRTVQSKRQALEKSNADALQKIQESMVKIISQIAKDRKANLVLQRSELVLFDQQFDVTDQVLQKLDEELPTLQVTFVEPVAAAPTAAPAKPAPKKK
ncbi:MAG TPA: OmpH family outer membrane protein [Stellaceae bacterium]|jgi:Skp family chaperone for outer membrane proteins